MPRTARLAVGGVVYHVVNRGNQRQRIFHTRSDGALFLDLLGRARQRTGTRVLAWCLMPNHWHLLLLPQADGELSRFMMWLTTTHAHRYRLRHEGNPGHLYQGRFKSFPVQDDAHLLTVARYVEANALRAGLVNRAEDWVWSSAAQSHGGDAACIDEWPVSRPANWLDIVNEPLTEPQLGRLRECAVHGLAYGERGWARRFSQEKVSAE